MIRSLREITMENFHDCLNLELEEAQKNYIATNQYSLAKAKADGVSVPLGIYDGETMVGFVMYNYNKEEQSGFISRLMVDRRHQGKGYGRYAMNQVIGRLRAHKDCKQIRISYVPENAVAGKLYESLGFVKTGEIVNGEVISALQNG